MNRNTRHWHDTPNNVIQMSNHYKRHFALIRQLQTNKPKPTSRRYKEIKRIKKEKTHNRNAVRSMRNEQISQENDKILRRIINITDRKPSSSYSKTASKSLNMSWHRQEESRISAQNNKLLNRLYNQQSDYRKNNPQYKEHKVQLSKISKFSEYNQVRLQSIIRSLKVSPRQATYLPSLRNDSSRSHNQPSDELLDLAANPLPLVPKNDRKKEREKEKQKAAKQARQARKEESPFRGGKRFWSRQKIPST